MTLFKAILQILKYILLIGGMIFWFTVVVGLSLSVEERVYDCTISEISPDFPIEVREECRRLRIVERRTQI
jgi:hypothetical protein